MRPTALTVLTALLLSTGCHHATIDTGLYPSYRTVENRWADGWFYGMVPPKVVDTAAECVTGVAMVDTKTSAPQFLVSVLTLGLYTPVTISVRCAARPVPGMKDVKVREIPRERIS